MGIVYRAVDVELGRLVALKVIAPAIAQDERFRERFLRESRIAAFFDHPHVVPIYQAGEEGGLLYLAMRYSTAIARVLGTSGITVLTRISGMLLAAIAAQLVGNAVFGFVDAYAG